MNRRSLSRHLRTTWSVEALNPESSSSWKQQSSTGVMCTNDPTSASAAWTSRSRTVWKERTRTRTHTHNQTKRAQAQSPRDQTRKLGFPFLGEVGGAWGLWTNLLPWGDEEAVAMLREAEVGDPVPRRVPQLPTQPDAAAASVDRLLAGGGSAHGGVRRRRRRRWWFWVALGAGELLGFAVGRMQWGAKFEPATSEPWSRARGLYRGNGFGEEWPLWCHRPWPGPPSYGLALPLTGLWIWAGCMAYRVNSAKSLF